MCFSSTIKLYMTSTNIVHKAAHRIGAPAVAGGFTALPGQRELQWKAGRVAVRPGVGRRRRLAVSCAGALRRGGQGEVLPHAAGGVGQLPGGLLGKFQKAALLAQQQRLLGLHGPAASTRPMAARQRRICAHRTKSSSEPAQRAGGLGGSFSGSGAAFSHMAYTSRVFYTRYAGGEKNIRPRR